MRPTRQNHSFPSRRTSGTAWARAGQAASTSRATNARSRSSRGRRPRAPPGIPCGRRRDGRRLPPNGVAAGYRDNGTPGERPESLGATTPLSRSTLMATTSRPSATSRARRSAARALFRRNQRRRAEVATRETPSRSQEPAAGRDEFPVLYRSLGSARIRKCLESTRPDRRIRGST